MLVFLLYLAVFLLIITFFKLVIIVPEQNAYVLEQLGKYYKTLGPGLHLVIPFIQNVAYKHSLKEEVYDVPPQECFTQDNVQVVVDGVLYITVMNPHDASYGIDNYKYAATQLAKTTMRSEIGKIPLDQTFSERVTINNAVVKSVDAAAAPWGIKITRYEIRDIDPNRSVIEAMQKQVEAERQKRAEILTSEGDRESRINSSKGERENAINLSKGEKQRKINESEGKAESIRIISEATAKGVSMIAQAIQRPKGRNAFILQMAEHYVDQLGTILEKSDVQVLPLELANMKSVVSTLLEPLRGEQGANIAAAAAVSRTKPQTGGQR